MHGLPPCGLLHSDICGSMSAYDSPQLFAVNHVLLRLPIPRHSLYALFRFTICFLAFSRSLMIFLLLQFSRLDFYSCRFLLTRSFLISFCFLSILFSSCFLFCSLFQEQISKDNENYLLIYILECIPFSLKLKSKKSRRQLFSLFAYFSFFQQKEK